MENPGHIEQRSHSEANSQREVPFKFIPVSDPNPPTVGDFQITRTPDKIHLVPEPVTSRNEKMHVKLNTAIRLLPPAPSTDCPQPEISDEALKDWRSLTMFKCPKMYLIVRLVYNNTPIPGNCILGISVAKHIMDSRVRIYPTRRQVWCRSACGKWWC